jgi:hypothetical protein
MYDRLTGSTTLMISSAGTTVPGSPVRPEYLKASVYLPPAFVTHNPDLHHDLIDIIQRYIEIVGVRTVNTWTQRARRDLGFTFTQVGNPQRNSHVNAFPTPDYNSSHFTFLGQPYRSTADLSPSSVRPLSPAASTDSYEDAFGEDPDDITLTILDLQEENHRLHEQIHNLQRRTNELEEEVKITHIRYSSLSTRINDRIMYLEAQLKRCTETTSSPVRNVNTKPAYPKMPLTPLRQGSVSPSPSRAPPTRSQIVSTVGMASSSSCGSLLPHYNEIVPTGNTDGMASSLSYRSLLLPRYIDLYHLGHLSTSINLVGDYTPAETRKEELLKLGLELNVCDALVEAMSLDKGLPHV